MPLNIARGLFRGATRGVLTGKKGNKQFYKGIYKTMLMIIICCTTRPYDSSSYQTNFHFARIMKKAEVHCFISNAMQCKIQVKGKLNVFMIFCFEIMS